MLKNQQEKERLKTQMLENTDNADRESRTRTKRPMTQPEDNGENIDDIALDPRGLKVKHPTLTKLRVQKRIGKCPGQKGMLQYLMILPQTQTHLMKIL